MAAESIWTVYAFIAQLQEEFCNGSSALGPSSDAAETSLALLERVPVC